MGELEGYTAEHLARDLDTIVPQYVLMSLLLEPHRQTPEDKYEHSREHSHAPGERDELLSLLEVQHELIEGRGSASAAAAE